MNQYHVIATDVRNSSCSATLPCGWPPDTCHVRARAHVRDERSAAITLSAETSEVRPGRIGDTLSAI
jgi:hypothetical protein